MRGEVVPGLPLTARYGAIKSAFSSAIDNYREAIPDAIRVDAVLNDLRHRHYAWIDCVVVSHDVGQPRWREDFLAALRHRQACLELLSSLPANDYAPYEAQRMKILDSLVPFLQRQGYSLEEIVAFIEGLFDLASGASRKRLAEWVGSKRTAEPVR
jgi:hypothetical protein